MNILTVYRVLLCLYPDDFRQQFAEEMLEIFQQRIDDLSTGGGAKFASFGLREFTGLLIGAAREWMAKIMPKKKYFVVSIPIVSKYFPKPTADEAAMSTPRLQQRHDTAKASMFQAASSHDFAAARAFEAEVARLRVFLHRRSRLHKD